MTKNPHLGVPIEVAGADRQSALLVLVVLHGRDQEPSFMKENLVDRLGRPDLTYLLPAADAHSWYPASFMAAFEENEPRLSYALERLEVIESALSAEGIPPAKVLWVGFSQGACVATEYVARSGERFGGLVSMTGGLFSPPGAPLSRPGDLTGMPALFATASRDALVPLERVPASAQVFRAAGAETELVVYPGDAHQVFGDEVQRCRRIIARVEARSEA